MIVFIFAMEKTPNWLKIAQGLTQAKLYGASWITLSVLEQQSKTRQNDLQISTEKIFVFVGHADKASYGGNERGDLQYSPQEFVEKVANWLPPSAETVILLGCELGFVQNGTCQALEIGKLLAEKRTILPNLAKLKNITSYLLEDNKLVPQKWLAGMMILLQPNATLRIYAWDHETELNFVKLRQRKFDLIKKLISIADSIKELSNFCANLPEMTSTTLKIECRNNLQAIIKQLSLLSEIKSENREKLLSNIQHYYRNNLFQFSKYESELKKKSLLTVDDYCLWHYKCLRAFQSCELLLNLQNLYVRDGSDKKRIIEVYNELQNKIKQFQDKYNINKVDLAIVDKAYKEIDSSKTDMQKYENFKSKLLLLSETDLNALDALLNEERTTYEASIKKLDKLDCDVNQIKAELNHLYENRLLQLSDQRKMFRAKLEAIEKIYEDSTREPGHLIENPMSIMDLLKRPEFNLLQRSAYSPTSSLSLLQPGLHNTELQQHAAELTEFTNAKQTTGSEQTTTGRFSKK